MKISSLPNSYTGNRLGRVPEPLKLTLMLYILKLYSNLSYDLPHPWPDQKVGSALRQVLAGRARVREGYWPGLWADL